MSSLKVNQEFLVFPRKNRNVFRTTQPSPFQFNKEIFGKYKLGLLSHIDLGSKGAMSAQDASLFVADGALGST